MYTCRECERPINQSTELCPYCGADLTEEGQALARGAAEPAKKRNPIVVATLIGAVLLGAVWGFLWFVLPERAGDPAAQAEELALQALREVRTALGSYAEAQGGYPNSLDALPHPAAESVRQVAQRAQSRGYQLQYTPGPPNAEGLVRSYRLLARPGHYGYRSFYADETGVLRATREDRAANERDPTVD